MVTSSMMEEDFGSQSDEFEVARVFGLQILDACLQDIAYARFLLRKNHERQKFYRRNVLRSSDESNVRKFPWPTAEENEIESRARGATSLYVPLNKAMLAASATTSSGATILHIMVYKDLWKQLQLLLDYGANPNLTNNNSETCLHWCAKLKCKRCAKVLLSHFFRIGQIIPALSCTDASGSNPLHSAVAAGNLTLIPLIIDYLEMQNTARDTDKQSDDLSVSSAVPTTPFTTVDVDNCTPIMVAVNYARATAAAIASATALESDSAKNAFANQYIDDGNVFIAITVLLLRYHQQHGLPIPPDALSISDSVMKSLAEPSITTVNDKSTMDALDLELSTLEGPQSSHMKWGNQAAIGRDSTLAGIPADNIQQPGAIQSSQSPLKMIDTSTVDFLLAQLSEQQRLLQEHRKLIQQAELHADSKTNEATSLKAKKNTNRPQTAPRNEKPNEFRRRDSPQAPPSDSKPTDLVDVSVEGGVGETTTENSSKKNKALPAINRPPLRASNNLKTSQSTPAITEAAVPPHTVIVYEKIAAGYKLQQQLNSNRQKVGTNVINSISYRKAQQEMASKSSTVLAANSNANDSPSPPKKPAFFIRKSDSLHHMPPVFKPIVHTKPLPVDGFPAESEAESADALDADIQTKLLKLTTSDSDKVRRRHNGKASLAASDLDATSVGSVSDAFNGSNATRISFDRRAGTNTKIISAIPNFEMLFPPAPSVPFLPVKTNRPSTVKSMMALSEAITHAASTTAPSSPPHPLPVTSRRMDVIIAVEHCFDCEQHSTQSLRHDPKKYVQMANDMLYSVIELISSSNVNQATGDDSFPVRLFCMRVKPTSSERLGAFEVTVAVNITPTAAFQAPQQQQLQQANQHGHGHSRRGSISNFRRQEPPAIVQPSIEEEDPVQSSVWATHLAFSKLQTKSWPCIKTVQKRINHFLIAVLNGERIKQQQQASTLRRSLLMRNEIENFLSNANNLLDDNKQSKINVLEESYRKWVERMRIPPKVERHALDLDWPSSVLASKTISQEADEKVQNGDKDKDKEKDKQHPRGPYIDFSLLGHMSTETFEDLVLRHFEVFDAT